VTSYNNQAEKLCHGWFDPVNNLRLTIPNRFTNVGFQLIKTKPEKFYGCKT